jgi:hypothetical protein
MRNTHVVIALVLVILLVMIVVFWRSGPEPVPAPVRDHEVFERPAEPDPESVWQEPVAPLPEPDPVVEPLEPEPLLVLPRLNESDDFARRRLLQLEAIEGEPVEAWLERDDVVRRLTVLVDNAATGNVPRQQLEPLALEAPFPVVRENESIYVDERGFQRYDRLVDMMVRIQPERAVSLLHTLSPLITQALQELGYRQPNPQARVRAAIDHALTTPVVEDRIELVQPGVLYQYADPDLEALTPLQKQLLRMGPDNVRRVQEYLREVRAVLDQGAPVAGGPR